MICRLPQLRGRCDADLELLSLGLTAPTGSTRRPSTRAAIPPHRHRKRQHAYDKALYKERNRVERFFSRIKHCRRIATLYDKLAVTFMGFVMLASIMLWLR